MYRPGLVHATFVGGATGKWNVASAHAVIGEGLPAVAALDVVVGDPIAPRGEWSIRGVTGHVRYTTRAEKTQLDPVSPALDRSEATCGAWIAIRKSPAWWALTQEERREVFEEKSRHIGDAMPYLPRIARRLYHARELGEPFDFLTWFEFAPEHTAAFDELLVMLRSRPEWTYVDREVELRLTRA